MINSLIKMLYYILTINKLNLFFIEKLQLRIFSTEDETTDIFRSRYREKMGPEEEPLDDKFVYNVFYSDRAFPNKKRAIFTSHLYSYSNELLIKDERMTLKKVLNLKKV